MFLKKRNKIRNHFMLKEASEAPLPQHLTTEDLSEEHDSSDDDDLHLVCYSYPLANYVFCAST